MDIPRGHAAVPLQDADFLDFVYNYFKAEYAPIRSFWSTATAEPRHISRWINMGHELLPLAIRPANAQAQKDLESLDFFTRKWNLDAGFIRGLVIRYSKYEMHERLEKKLYECARLDLMVRKALKEKHVIDALWPSPAPRNLAQELLQQGVQVRKWYGDMFGKYFRVLKSVESFELRPEIDQRIKSSGTLMLFPFVDHLIFGAVDPIIPIVARGGGYANVKGWDKKNIPGFGEPGRFEIRFDAPAEVTDTYTKSVVRQCQCMKCGTRRDVQVVISVDPNPNGAPSTSASTSTPSASKTPKAHKISRHPTKTDRYAPGYALPGESHAEARPPQPQPPRAVSPELKKQCPRCTFLNHPTLTACEMCDAELPETTIAKPPSPATVKKSSHSHRASAPPPARATETEEVKRDDRPTSLTALNRNTLSQSLFSIFPFNQQHQQEHHAKLPATQQTDTSPATRSDAQPEQTRFKDTESSRESRSAEPKSRRPKAPEVAQQEPTPPVRPQTPSQQIQPQPQPQPNVQEQDETPLSRAPEMALMPLTPPPTTSSTRLAPAGLPTNLMDDFIPVSPALPVEDEGEDAGWGEMSRDEVGRVSSDEEEGEEAGRGFIDLDAVALGEAGVWGEDEGDGEDDRDEREEEGKRLVPHEEGKW